MTPRPIKKRFTLIELIVAMGILLVVGLIIGTASMTFLNAWKRSVRITDELKRNLQIDRLMDQNVRNMIPFYWHEEETLHYLFSGEKDAMFFTCKRRAYDGDAGAFLFISLKLDGDHLIARYSPYPRLTWEEEDQRSWTTEVLSTNVQSISFTYAARTGSDAEIVWLDTWEEYDAESADQTYTSAIPLAVQMKIEWKNGDSEVWLRRTAGSAWNAQFGADMSKSANRAQQRTNTR